MFGAFGRYGQAAKPAAQGAQPDPTATSAAPQAAPPAPGPGGWLGRGHGAPHGPMPQQMGAFSAPQAAPQGAPGFQQWQSGSGAVQRPSSSQVYGSGGQGFIDPFTRENKGVSAAPPRPVYDRASAMTAANSGPYDYLKDSFFSSGERDLIAKQMAAQEKRGNSFFGKLSQHFTRAFTGNKDYVPSYTPGSTASAMRMLSDYYAGQDRQRDAWRNGSG